MATKLVQDSSLTSVANAIRAKGGTSAALEFPTDFVTAIQNIPSGSGEPSNIITGTFKDTTGESGTLSIDLPYSGNGYPIGVWIHAADWSNIASLIHKDGVLDCVIWKSYESTAPAYAGSTGTSDAALKDRTGLMLHYKSSTSSGTTTTVYKVPGSDTTQANYRPAPATANYRHLCAITSATNLKVAVSGESATRGFMTGVEYRYVVVYSE